jgi:DNA-binding transcriptional ArsR family regulator
MRVDALAPAIYFDNNRNMETKAALKALAALAQETRLGIFRHLVERGPDGAVAGLIADELRIPAATLSFHLKEMIHAELLESAQEGRFVRYTASLAVVQDLVGFLTENCCGGDASKCAPVCAPSPGNAKPNAKPRVRTPAKSGPTARKSAVAKPEAGKRKSVRTR